MLFNIRQLCERANLPLTSDFTVGKGGASVRFRAPSTGGVPQSIEDFISAARSMGFKKFSTRVEIVYVDGEGELHPLWHTLHRPDYMDSQVYEFLTGLLREAFAKNDGRYEASPLRVHSFDVTAYKTGKVHVGRGFERTELPFALTNRIAHLDEAKQLHHILNLKRGSKDKYQSRCFYYALLGYVAMRIHTSHIGHRTRSDYVPDPEFAKRVQKFKGKELKGSSTNVLDKVLDDWTYYIQYLRLCFDESAKTTLLKIRDLCDEHRGFSPTGWVSDSHCPQMLSLTQKLSKELSTHFHFKEFDFSEKYSYVPIVLARPKSHLPTWHNATLFLVDKHWFYSEKPFPLMCDDAELEKFRCEPDPACLSLSCVSSESLSCRQGNSMHWICPNCDTMFHKNGMHKHLNSCVKVGRDQRIAFDTGDIKFDAHPKTLLRDVVFYADFEAYNLPDGDRTLQVALQGGFYIVAQFPFEGCDQISTWDEDYERYTQAGYLHGEWVGYTKLVLCDISQDAGESFLHKLCEWHRYLQTYRDRAKREYSMYNGSEIAYGQCQLCHSAPGTERHHCHLSGRFLYPACTNCNRSMKLRPGLSAACLFFNMNYDLSHIFHALPQCVDELYLTTGHDEPTPITIHASGQDRNHLKTFKMRENLSEWMTDAHGIPKRNYAINEIEFLDAAAIMGLGTLDKHLQCVPREKRYHIRQWAGALFDTVLESGSIIDAKGLFPYDYFTGEWHEIEEKLNGPIQLLPIEAFVSSLSQEMGIEGEEPDLRPSPELIKNHAHLLNIASHLRWTSVRDLLAHYLSLDLVGLADVVETHRRRTMQSKCLDPTHFPTAPGMSYSALLLHLMQENTYKLKNLQCAQEVIDLELAKRGGLSFVHTRHKQSNAPGDPSYDPSQPTVNLEYWDATNLYGYAMQQPLPTGPGTVVKDCSHIDRAFLASLPSDELYLLCVDLHFPEEKHDYMKWLPPAPEHKFIPEEWLSEHQREVWATDRAGKYESTQKLVCDLHDRTEYWVGSHLLSVYLDIGVELVTVHAAYKYKAVPWMASYINLNTEERNDCKANGDTIGSNFFKLLNNSVYGKTIENKRDRGSFEFVQVKDDTERLVQIHSNPNFKGYLFTLTPEGEEEASFFGCETLSPTYKVNVPLFAGVFILDYSKAIMYRHWYTMQRECEKLGARIGLIYMDTDSFCFYIEWDEGDSGLYPLSTGRFQQIMPSDVADYQGFPLSNPRKGELGLLTNELVGKKGSKRLMEQWALRSKMHFGISSKEEWDGERLTSFTPGDDDKAKVKGVPQKLTETFLSKKRTWDEALYEGKMEGVFKVRMGTVLARDSMRQEIKRAKRARPLSRFDDKLYQLDATTSLPHGHYACRSE